MTLTHFPYRSRLTNEPSDLRIYQCRCGSFHVETQFIRLTLTEAELREHLLLAADGRNTPYDGDRT